MILLGIDYGRVHVGLALSQTGIPAPLTAFSTKSDERKLEVIKSEIEKNNVDAIVIGEGSGFIGKLKKIINIPIYTVDETLTSNEAIPYMIKNNVPLKKRRILEHAYAACILLEHYYEQKRQ